MAYNSEIYPHLEKVAASAPPQDEETVASYRLKKITEAEHFLRDEIDYRNKLAKKLKRTSHATRIVDMSLKMSSVLIEAGSITAIATGIGAPLALIFGSVGIAIIASTSITQKYIKIFDTKRSKHNQIKLLAETKLDSILETISHALEDGDINQTEFKRVLDEIKNYRRLKEDIRQKQIPHITDSEREAIKKSVASDFIKKLKIDKE